MANATGKITVKQPSVFKLNSIDDYPTWYAQFNNYADAVKIDTADRFVALRSFLDTPAFTVVENLEIADADKADPAKFGPILEGALKREDEIPPRLALRYRAQEPKESLADFAFALELLANKADIPRATRPELLVDSFCTGVRDTELSIKLLETSFNSLTVALDQAQKIEGASKIRNFVRPATTTSADDDNGLEILASETTSAQQTSTAGQASSNNSRPNRNFGGNENYDPNAPNFQPGRPEHTMGNNSSHYRNNRAGYNSRPDYNRPASFGPDNRGVHGTGSSNMNSQKRCWYCNRPGHLIRNCRTRTSDQARNFPAGPSPRQ